MPGVVLLHTGRSDRTAYARLERLLTDAGLAVLNIDWRGRGESTNLGTYFDLDDATKAAALARRRSRAGGAGGRPSSRRHAARCGRLRARSRVRRTRRLARPTRAGARRSSPATAPANLRKRNC